MIDTPARIFVPIRWLFFLFFLLPGIRSGIYAQAKADSLKTVLTKKIHDTSRVATLNELAQFYQDHDRRKSKSYALLCFNLGHRYLKTHTTKNEIKKSLYHHLGNSTYLLANHYNDLAYPDSAQYYFSISLRYWKALGKKKQQSFVYNGMGLMYKDLGKYEEAIRYLNHSIDLKKQLGDQAGLARSLSNLSMVYSGKGDYAKAHALLQQAIELNRLQNNNNGLADNYSNIGMVFISQKKYKDALEVNFKALAYINNPKTDSIKLAKTYHDIAVSYKALKEFEKSITYFSKSLHIAKKLGNSFISAVNNVSLADVYAAKNDYKTATAYVLRALPYLNQSKHNTALATAHANLGLYLMKQEKYADAEKHYLQSTQIADSTGNTKISHEVYGRLAELYENQKNFPASLHCFKLYQQLGDSLKNIENMKQINEIEGKFKTELKDQKINFLTKEKKLEKKKFDATIREQAMWQKILIIGFLVALAFIAVIVIGYRQKIKSNALLAAKTKEINEQKATLKGQEEERKRIAQELHDGIGGSLAAIKLNLTHLYTKHDFNELSPVIDNLGETCKEVRNISHNLSPPVFDHLPFTKVLKNYVEKMSAPSQLQIQLEFFPESELNLLPATLQTEVYRLIQEALNNVNRHANASMVEIALSIEDKILFVMVEDNGRGFDAKAAHTGLGIQNMESRVKAFNGELMIESKPNRGTALHFRLPVI